MIINKYKSTNNKLFTTSETYFAILLFGFVFFPFLIYGLRQGFYWDDWSQLLLHEKFGDANFWTYFAYDRPFSALTHVVYFPILGKSPAVWHFFFAVLRFLFYYLTYRLFNCLFPEHSSISKVAALLLSICSLFSQYHISIAYSQHYTDFLFYLASCLLLLKGLKKDKTGKMIVWFALSFVCTALHLAITEYFAVLELLKVLMIAMLWRRNTNYSDRKFKITAAVSIIIFIAYIVIRLSISSWDPLFDGNKASVLQQLKTDFFGTIWYLVKNILSDLSVLVLDFWGDLFSIDRKYLFTLSGALILLLSVSYGVVTYYFIKWSNEARSDRIPWHILIFGILWILLGITPFWMIGESYYATNDIAHADRCFLAAAPGFTLVLSFILSALFTDSKRYSIASAALVTLLSIGLFRAQQDAIYETKKQTRFYEQIVTRIPGFTGTAAIVADDPIFPNEGNFATSSALNILYADSNMDLQDELPVWIFGTRNQEWNESVSFSVQKRNYHLATNRMIYIIPDPQFGNCVWVLGPDDVDNPYLTDTQRSWAAASDLSLIDTDAKSPWDETIFGDQNESWCVLYQKAQLLKQAGKTEEYEELSAYVKEHYSLDMAASNSAIEWEIFSSK